MIIFVVESCFSIDSCILKLGKSWINGLWNLHCFTDVAIGAPKEDNYIGAVYIYHGDANGIIPQYSMVCDTIVYDPWLKVIFPQPAEINPN